MGKDVSQVRHEVEAAREDVAKAVEALVYKLNAPKRLKERVATTVRTAKERTATKANDAKEQMAERIGDLGGNGDTPTAETPPPVERPEPVVAPAAPEEQLP